VTAQKALRLWPGITAAALFILARVVAPFVPDGDLIALITGEVAALVILLWWLFVSRAPWSERIGALVVMAIAMVLTWRIVDKSVATGMMGAMVPVLSIQTMSVALVVWAWATERQPKRIRRASMVLIIVGACTVLALVRTAGIGGGKIVNLHWRWTPTPEDRLLAEAAKEAPLPLPAPDTPRVETPAVAPEEARPAASPSIADAPGEEPVATRPTTVPRALADWPGFRGGDRNSVVRSVRIDTDWSSSPPVVMWRRPIGPGWSSFAVDGDLLYTQEQRGDDELVAAYRVSSGEPVWRHRDVARFWESNGGAGPRATPTIDSGRVYAFGATGILNALDAKSGAVLWSRNVAADSGIAVPMWGFSSSPLIVGNELVVAAAGKLAAYDMATGKPRWFGPDSGFSYSSPQLLTLGGVTQVLLLANDAVSVSPVDGTVLWKHAWSGGAIVQPALVDGDVLINALPLTGGNGGIRRLAVAPRPGGEWNVQERWTSSGLKPYYDDFVVHKGFAFGADGSILACIDLADGSRKWKGGRYGGAQVLLLPDQDLLFVLSEEGEIALVSATPDQFKEIARIPALDGKTWNHPVIVRDVLLVRNGEEMAAFRLPVLKH
jgi:outer membrane protein assembly factor BamB